MNKNRYVDKSILCEFELDEGLFNELNLKVEDIVPLRKVFVLFTDKGKKILKLCTLEDKKINFIDNALEYVCANDPNILKYCRNCRGEIVTKWNNKKYVVLNMIEGREASYTNPIDIEGCVAAVAKMHEASKGIIDYLAKKNINQEKINNVIDEYVKDYDIILEIEKMVNKYKYKSEFDKLFLNTVGEAQRQMNRAIDKLMKSDYEELIKNKDKMVLCHNDLAHHNFIIDGEHISLIDFDYCNINTRAMDIANFTGKVIKNLAYDKEMVKTILNEYKKISKVSNEEIEVAMDLIAYPKDFVTISKLYYFKQKPWEEDVFINRFKTKLDIEDFRKEFLMVPMSYFIK